MARHLRGVALDGLAVVAFASIVFGVWQWVHWLAFIVGGVMVLSALFMLERPRGEVNE